MKSGNFVQRPRRAVKTVVIAARVEEAFREKFWHACARIGLSESDAVREAVDEWVAARQSRPAVDPSDRLQLPKSDLLHLNAGRKGKIKD